MSVSVFKQLLTIEEAATELHCSRRRVFQLLESGQLQRGVRLGKRGRVTRESVDALVAPLPLPRPPKPDPKPRFARERIDSGR